MTLERRSQLLFWALAGVALLVAHDLVWLVQIGPGDGLVRALRQGSHAYWSAASIVLTVAAGAAVIVAAIHLVRLGLRARRVRAAVRPAPKRTYLRRAVATWARMAALVAVAFVLQENVEHALTHGHLPGIGILHGPEYPLALPVIAAVTLVGALAVGAVIQTDASLVAAIEAAVRRLRRIPPPVVRCPSRVLVRLGSPVASHGAGRAPPVLLVAV